MATETKEMELASRQDLLVLYELIYHCNSGFGVGEEDLLKTLSLPRPQLYQVLCPLIHRGMVEVRLQQIGTGGTCDHFYRLKEPSIICVQPKQPK